LSFEVRIIPITINSLSILLVNFSCAISAHLFNSIGIINTVLEAMALPLKHFFSRVQVNYQKTIYNILPIKTIT